MEAFEILWVILGYVFVTLLGAIMFKYKDEMLQFHDKIQKEAQIRQLKKFIMSYRPCSTLTEADVKPEKIPEKLVIALFGNTGVGKSSLINSFICLLHGHEDKSMAPVAAEEIMRGHTITRNEHGLTAGIKFVDNRGMDELSAESTVEELAAQLAGKRGYSLRVNLDSSNDTSNPRDINAEKAHIAVMVCRGNREQTEVENTMKFVETFQENQGRPPYGVITHIDNTGPEELEATTYFLRAVGVSDIFPVENTRSEKRNLELDTQLNLLRLLKRCIIDGDWIMCFHARQEIEQSQVRLLKEDYEAQQIVLEKERKKLEQEQQMEFERKQQIQDKRTQAERKHEQEMKSLEVQVMALEHKKEKEQEELRYKLEMEMEIKRQEYEQKRLESERKEKIKQENTRREHEERMARIKKEQEEIKVKEGIERMRIKKEQEDAENNRKHEERLKKLDVERKVKEKAITESAETERKNRWFPWFRG